MNAADLGHEHVFLGERHAQAERNVWATVALTLAMMAIEIVGGVWFGSIALVADGFHMSTHAAALAIAAIAYALARRFAQDARFTFGTGKFGDLAGFSSALILALVALEVGWEAVSRLLAPHSIAFAEAIPIAALGLLVNLASAWLLSRGGGHRHSHGHEHRHDESRSVELSGRICRLSIFEAGGPAKFRLHGTVAGATAGVETLRPDGSRQSFLLRDCGGFLESQEIILEPHAFEAVVELDGRRASVAFAEAAHDATDRDHNLSAALLHVVADAAVSVLVILGLTLAYAFGWWILDPLAALVGAVVIASWSYQLIRDTGRVLLDVNPDERLGELLRAAVEREGDALTDLHLWRLGPGHLGAILSIATTRERDCGYYRRAIGDIAPFSHLTVEVTAAGEPASPRRAVA